MNILHIHWRYDTFGGGEKYLFDLCKAQEEAGHSVSILSSLSFNSDTIAKNKNVYLIDNSFGIRSGYRMLNQVRQIVQNTNPDIIHLHETLGFLSPLIVNKLLKHKPVIQTLHTAFFFCPLSTKILPNEDICQFRLGTRCLREGCFKKADLLLAFNMLWRIQVTKKLAQIIVPSKYLKDEAINNGIPSDNIDVVSHFTGKNPENKYIAPENNSILFVGRRDPLKGLDELLKALHLIKYQSWKAYVVGGSSYHEKSSLELGIRDKIVFLDNLSSPALDEYYKKSSLVVFPSINPESFGLVGIEAMSFGRPVVAFDVGGPREWLLDNQTGFLCGRSDINCLAVYIKKLLKDKKLGHQMGQKGMERVTKLYRKDIHITHLLRIYEKAVAERMKSGDTL